MSRGCKSNTSCAQTSSVTSESIDVNQLPETSTEKVSELLPQKENENKPSESSSSHNYVAMEIEEGIHMTLSSETNYDQQTFESKPSATTYIDSNEEFMYETKDLLPGPLNLEL